MSHVVAKDFRSVNRRFKTGQPVAPSDIDHGCALKFDDWVARGFIKSARPAPVEVKEPRAKPAPRSSWRSVVATPEPGED